MTLEVPKRFERNSREICYDISESFIFIDNEINPKESIKVEK